jgi:hypothetical protein
MSDTIVTALAALGGVLISGAFTLGAVVITNSAARRRGVEAREAEKQRDFQTWLRNTRFQFYSELIGVANSIVASGNLAMLGHDPQLSHESLNSFVIYQWKVEMVASQQLNEIVDAISDWFNATMEYRSHTEQGAADSSSKPDRQKGLDLLKDLQRQMKADLEKAELAAG